MHSRCFDRNREQFLHNFDVNCGGASFAARNDMTVDSRKSRNRRKGWVNESISARVLSRSIFPRP